MKKLLFSIIIATGGLWAQTASAQVGVNVGVRIGPLVINVHKPVAPAVVYDDFYYLPDVEAYYSVPEHCYYYMDVDRRWVSGAYLPGRYHDFDWRSGRRYQVRAQRPYNNHDFYRNRFGGNPGRNWSNNPYANQARGRRGDNDYNRRLPDSPFDSNNAGGRGNWNRNDDRWVERDRPYSDNRNRGGYNNGSPNRGNDNNNWQRGEDNRGYGRPSNNDNNHNDNRGRGENRGGDYQQRYTQNNDNSVRPQLSGNRYSF